MAFKHFKHLNVPDSWERYFTKYPQGMSILESLFEWVSQVDNMTDNINTWNEYLVKFVATFDKELQQTVTDTLSDWQESGFIDVVISDALQWQLTDYIATNEADKLSLETQLEQTDQELTSQLAQISVNAKTLGLKGDGTNETYVLKNAIEYAADNHLTLLIPKDMTVTSNRIAIADKYNFGLKVEGVIKRVENGEPGGMLSFTNCNNFNIPITRFDGRGVENGADENIPYTPEIQQQHCLMFINCHDFDIGIVKANNIAGDVIYISAGSKNIRIEKIIGKADTKIGRNLLSVISAEDIFIDTLQGINFGHYTMPGGFDIEPNNDTEIVRNIFVNNMNIVSGGTNPLSVLNIRGSLVENVFIDKANIVCSSIPSYSGARAAMLSGENVTINHLSVDGENKAGVIDVDNHSPLTRRTNKITIKKLNGRNASTGIRMGFNGKVQNIEINANIRNLTGDGVILHHCDNVSLDLDIDSVGAARSMINSSPNTTGTVENVYITGNISKRGTGIKAIISNADPSKNKNWTLENLDFTGWGNDSRLFGGGLATSIRKLNCPNLTELPAKPNFEKWLKGDYVRNTEPNELGESGTKYIVKGWVAIANGSGSGIWVEDKVLTGN